MPNYSYGLIVKKRTELVIEALLNYAENNLKVDKELSSEITIEKKSETNELTVKAPLTALEYLTDIQKQENIQKLEEEPATKENKEKLKELKKLLITAETIREVLRYYLKHFLEILDDQRMLDEISNSKDRRFTLKLWSEDIKENLIEFDKHWNINLDLKLKRTDNLKIFISDRSQNKEPDRVEQLRTTLSNAGYKTIINDNWLEFEEVDLDECICFILVVSSDSLNESEILIQEIQKAKDLQKTRQDRTLKILLIHANSYLPLPLNNPLSQLQSITSLELHSSTNLETLVEEIKRCIEAKEQKNSEDFTSLIHNLQKQENPNHWVVTYVGENQLLNLGELVGDLKENDNKKIRSKYAYCGSSPTQLWIEACNNPTYHMRENLRQFPNNIEQLAEYVDEERYNFVSLGVGEGSKDKSIIEKFFGIGKSSKPRNDFYYLAVDMSLDMLMTATREIQQLPSHRRIAIQRNIETKDGMEEIARIANELGKDKPLLYGFIGNTIANVDDPEQVLDNIVQVMNSDDLLLFEAQIINDSILETAERESIIRLAEREYEPKAFQKFALSALLQNSDLTVEPNQKDNCYRVRGDLKNCKHGIILEIECSFVNNTDENVYLTFSTGDNITLCRGDTISLYRSQKFTQTALENFVRSMQLNILNKSVYLNNNGTGFMVMMLQRK